MATRKTRTQRPAKSTRNPAVTPPVAPEDAIVDINVESELERSYLEYSLSVIVSRAIPDARDGLKPVQRRLLYAMDEAGLRSDRPYRKSVSAVGDTMKKYHPHGDQSIYDALVRMAQPWSMGVPLVDGHGNFGSRDDGSAAMRYTEARLAPSAEALLDGVGEDTVEMVANFDSSGAEPVVLPAAYPNLLANGAAGIAVGMATNIPPHNLGEVATAVKHLLANPKATAADLVAFVPAPDFPTGGISVGLDGPRDALVSGRGTVRLRARCTIEDVSARRRGIVVTELPYNVGPERVITRIKELVADKKLDGIADVKDLSDRRHGLRIVIEVRAGFDPRALLAQLYKLTPLEEPFNVNAVALVGGKPQLCSLLDLCQAFVSHRIEVIQRRSRFRLAKAEARAHILEGLLKALDAIDEVVALIRASRDTATAREKLRKRLAITDIQADAILEMPLRRLTSLEASKLKADLRDVQAEIRELTALLGSPKRQRTVLAAELDAAVAAFGTPRRTSLQRSDDLADVTAAPAGPAPKPASSTTAAKDEPLTEGSSKSAAAKGGASKSGTATKAAAAPAGLLVADAPCVVAVTADGIARVTAGGKGAPLQAVGSVVTTTRSRVGVVRADGTVVAVDVVELPEVAARSRGGLVPLSEFGSAIPAVGVITLDPGVDVALGTAAGVVKRVAADALPTAVQLTRAGAAGVPLVALADGDRVLHAAPAPDGTWCVFVTSDAQLLRFESSSVRPQGRTAGGMAGVKLADGASAVAFAVAPAGCDGWEVVTVSDAGNAKRSALAEYPPKGRATMGVRCQTFKRVDTALTGAVTGPAVAANAALMEPARRDASGQEWDASGLVPGVVTLPG
jgi:DNA gyrase subunit A